MSRERPPVEVGGLAGKLIPTFNQRYFLRTWHILSRMLYQPRISDNRILSDTKEVVAFELINIWRYHGLFTIDEFKVKAKILLDYEKFSQMRTVPKGQTLENSSRYFEKVQRN